MRAIMTAVALLALSTASLRAQSDNTGTFKAKLSGYNEVLPVYTAATGDATVRVEESPARIVVTLQYSNLGSTPTMAHLHWGQKGVNGPVILPICGPGGETCPANGVEKTFTLQPTALAAAGPSGQATGFFPAGNIAALLAGLRNGAVYLNVHTTTLGGGEVRGQLGRGNSGRGRSDDDENPGRGNEKGKGKNK